MSDRYPAHEVLVAPARRFPELWRLVGGLVLAAGLMFGMGVVLRGLIALFNGPGPGLMEDLGTGNTPQSLLVALYSYGLVILAVAVAARLMQGRGFAGLIGPLPLAVRQFWAVLRMMVLLHIALMLLPPYDSPGEVVPNLDFMTWAALLPLSLTAILVQTGSEELLFRGYIQQSLAARFSSPLVWMLVPAILFGIGHYQPDVAGDNAWLVTLWAVVFGVLTADLTARAGTLGPAIAFHLANNAGALLLVSLPDQQSGLALATTTQGASDTEFMGRWFIFGFAFLIVGWLAARVAIRR